MKRSNERSLDQVIEDMVDAFGLREKLDEQTISSSWDQVAGAMVARHTKRIRLRNGKVTITVDSAPLRHELGYMKATLTELLNRRVGRQIVTEIVID